MDHTELLFGKIFLRRNNEKQQQKRLEKVYFPPVFSSPFYR